MKGTYQRVESRTGVLRVVERQVSEPGADSDSEFEVEAWWNLSPPMRPTVTGIYPGENCRGRSGHEGWVA